MNFFAKNLKFLRAQSGKTQAEIASAMGFKQNSWNNYENDKSYPAFLDLMDIIKYFGISASDLLEKDLSNVHLNEKVESSNNHENVHPIVHPSVHLKPEKGYVQKEIKITIAADQGIEYGGRGSLIPITDISVAAGAGIFNSEYIENVESMRLPPALMKPGGTYLCVRVKGISMAPTLQDGGYVIIRMLERSEWAKMPDERIYVVSDTEGKTALKRVKNRFKQGFIVMRSDSPDTAVFPSYNLQVDEINTIWYVEWYFSAKMPNIHDQFYSRLQLLEDRVDEMSQGKHRMNTK